MGRALFRCLTCQKPAPPAGCSMTFLGRQAGRRKAPGCHLCLACTRKKENAIFIIIAKDTGAAEYSSDISLKHVAHHYKHVSTNR